MKEPSKELSDWRKQKGHLAERKEERDEKIRMKKKENIEQQLQDNNNEKENSNGNNGISGSNIDVNQEDMVRLVSYI